jgi:hypothetical protein
VYKETITKKLEIMKKLFKIGYSKTTNCGWLEITEKEWEDIKIQYVKDYGRYLTMNVYDKGELIGYGIY